jgi:hypothetical protein
MRIYIDEAGGFVVPTQNRPYSYSLVLSLAVPSESEAELLYEFVRLRDAWGLSEVEIKGRQLNEVQAATVIDLVTRYDVLVTYCSVNMSTHGDHVVSDFKLRQAAEITAHLTREHHPELVAQMHRDADGMRALSNHFRIDFAPSLQ